MSQPNIMYPETINIITKPRKRSKTPHDPSTPTILTYDWEVVGGDINDPHSVFEQWNNNLQNDYGSLQTSSHTLITPGTTGNMNQRYEGRISLPSYINNNSMNMLRNNSAHAPNNKIFTIQSSNRHMKKRHSEQILAKNRHKKRRKSRRRSKNIGKNVTKLRRSASVDDHNRDNENKVLKDRTHKKKRHSVNKMGKRRKSKRKSRSDKPFAKSENFTAMQPSQQIIQGMSPIDLGSNNNSKKVRFMTNKHDDNDDKTVDDIIGDILHINVGGNIVNNSKKTTPTSVTELSHTHTHTDDMNGMILQDDDEDSMHLDDDDDEHNIAPEPDDFKLKKLQIKTKSSGTGSINTVPTIALPNISSKSDGATSTAVPGMFGDDDDYSPLNLAPNPITNPNIPNINTNDINNSLFDYVNNNDNDTNNTNTNTNHKIAIGIKIKTNSNTTNTDNDIENDIENDTYTNDNNDLHISHNYEHDDLDNDNDNLDDDLEEEEYEDDDEYEDDSDSELDS
eukprot:525884_1